MHQKHLYYGKREFIISSESEPLSFSFHQLSAENEGTLSEYELSVEMGSRKAAPLSIKWTSHMTGLLSFWSPTVKRDRGVMQWYNANTNISNMYYGAPVISVIQQGDENFSTVAVSDAVHPIRMTFSVNDFEEKENLDFYIYLFEEGCPEGVYTARIRIDERKIPYYQAIGSVSGWWKFFYPTDRTGTESGELPLYSTWYNYHQNPTQESLERESALAGACGFGSLILDDGWSYDGTGSGDYRDCGNWKVVESKFPDFKGFVEKLHDRNMKAAVWFPVPFVGFQSEDYQRFQGKILYNSVGYQAGIVDPRYPDVRKYITDTYVDMVSRYDLDGLKLDFIDSFRCTDDTLLCTDKSPDYDCEEVEEGVILLLQEIRQALTSRKSDFMIEFRQFYVGPAIVRDCNMLRVLDCPFDYITNRVGIVDLRLLNYDLAVHADMLIWAKDEKLETSAKMLLNILFGVPQISVLLQNSSDEQKKLITAYVHYWYENRKILLHGEFKAKHPEACYSLVSSESEYKRIAAAYAENVLSFDGKESDIFNATETENMYLENASGSSAEVKIYDCLGNQVDSATVLPGIVKLAVPQGGRMNVTVIKK